MKNRNYRIKIGSQYISNNLPFILIAGPCVIKDFEETLRIASYLKKITSKNKIPFIFKASFDKANRSSINSYRGPGLEKGIKILEKVKKKLGVYITTDIHSINEIESVSLVADIIQIPAFLSRQTDIITNAAKTNKIINVKKGQFLAPEDMGNIVEKVNSCGNKKVILTERGTSFGYHNLVVDMRGIEKISFLVI